MTVRSHRAAEVTDGGCVARETAMRAECHRRGLVLETPHGDATHAVARDEPARVGGDGGCLEHLRDGRWWEVMGDGGRWWEMV